MRCNWKSSVQKWLRNTLSQSNIIERVLPWRWTTSLGKVVDMIIVEYRCFKGMKCAYLERQSTTTKIESNSFDRGSPFMKSMVRSSQIRFGIGRGCKTSAGDKARFLFCWANSTLNHKFFLYPLSSPPNINHEQSFYMFLRTQNRLSLPPVWNSRNIAVTTLELRGRTSHPWYNKRPFSKEYFSQDSEPVANSSCMWARYGSASNWVPIVWMSNTKGLVRLENSS